MKPDKALGLLRQAPNKLRRLAEWIDLKYPDDQSPQVQRDLRRWADGIDALLAQEPKAAPQKVVAVKSDSESKAHGSGITPSASAAPDSGEGIESIREIILQAKVRLADTAISGSTITGHVWLHTGEQVQSMFDWLLNALSL